MPVKYLQGFELIKSLPYSLYVTGVCATSHARLKLRFQPALSHAEGKADFTILLTVRSFLQISLKLAVPVPLPC